MLIQPTECIDRLQLFTTRSQLKCERESATSIMVYSPSEQSWLVVRYSRGGLTVALYESMALLYSSRFDYNALTVETLEGICKKITSMAGRS